MGFTDLQIKRSYETGTDDLVEDFYIPVLSNAVQYDRISGFFSSTSLALAARGLMGLISNIDENSPNKCVMRLVTCPRLTPDDARMISENNGNPESIMTESMNFELDNICDEFMKDHVAALGWMLSKGYLQIKIALVTRNGHVIYDEDELSNSIMHQKVGILYDRYKHGISFSGSNNESASGWLDNIEEFKVFKNWNEGQKEYFEDDQRKFSEFWSGTKKGVRIIDLPTAVHEKLIKAGADFHPEKLALDRYKGRIKTPTVDIERKRPVNLFPYQDDAKQMWIENDMNLLFEMATGTGKTMTAIGCTKHFLSSNSEHSIVIISCPQSTLSMQWKNNIDSLDVDVESDVFCDSTNPGWKTELQKAILQVMTGYYKNLFIYTTHQTCSSPDFIDIIEKTVGMIEYLFVGDEVHGMGASKTKNGLLAPYKYRIGLSATPSRWFDDAGSKLIRNYFNNQSYVFSIFDALTKVNPKTGKTFLVNYTYHPEFISLNDGELEEYYKLSERIKKMGRMKDTSEIESKLERLLFYRANIEKSADNKYEKLEEILMKIGDDISDTIIFVSDSQINKVMEILFNHNIRGHRFTQAESPKPSAKYGGISERDDIINRFKDGEYQVLVAIKCLDEGIDIPSAKRGIIMASSTNPREYVQRIGRIIRQDKNKPNAELYDMIIQPDMSGFQDDEMAKMELSIFKKEMVRVKELSENALNNAQVLVTINDILGGLE